MSTKESPAIGVSAVEWAKENCTEQRWWTPADNYQIPRDHFVGSLYEYLFEGGERDGETGIVLVPNEQMRDSRNAGYLLDDGRSVRAFYVAGWAQDESHILLKPMPTNYDRHGDRLVRPSDGREVDMGSWVLGPRRYYHLKVGD